MTKVNNLALVFPGQGSQKVGMLGALASKFPSVITVFSEASETLGYDAWKLVQEGSPASLNLTEYTQPILLTASVAIWQIWQQQGGMKPALMAGHSLGEWSALVCSEVVAFADAVKLVQQRGQLMQQAVPEGQGAMAAIIGLDDVAVGIACDDAVQSQMARENDTEKQHVGNQHVGNQIVAPVNFNAPGQVVIAGNVAAVDRAILNCKKLGAKRVLPLPVSAPFHTQLMRPAAEKLAHQMENVLFHHPRIPIVHNVNAQVELDSNKIKQLMISQIYQPVLWVSCVNTLVKSGIKSIVECGPGKVLTGLTKRIDRSLATAVTEDPDDFSHALQLSMASERNQ